MLNLKTFLHDCLDVEGKEEKEFKEPRFLA